MKKTKLLYFPIVFVIIFFSMNVTNAFFFDPGGGDDPPPPPQVTTTFKAYICNQKVYDKSTDSFTSVAISGATVTLKKGSTVIQTKTTSSSGWVTFSPVTDDAHRQYTITCQKNGYASASASIYTGTVDGQTVSKSVSLNKISKWAVIVGGYGSAGSSGSVKIYNLCKNLLFFDTIFIFGHPGIYDPVSIPHNGWDLKDNIRDKVQLIATRADANDIVCFFYLGHGDFEGHEEDENQNIIDGDINESYMSLKDNGYHDDELYNDLKDTAAAQILVWLESCFDGGFVDDFLTFPNDERLLLLTHAPPGYFSVLESYGAWFTNGYIIHSQPTENTIGIWNNNLFNSLEVIFCAAKCDAPLPYEFEFWDGHTARYDPQLLDGSASFFYIKPYPP